MADFSLLSSIASLLDIGIRCGKSIGRLIIEHRHAPDELLVTSNEVSDFNVILTEVDATCSTLNLSPTGPQTQFIAALTNELDKARTALTALDKSVHSMYTTRLSPGATEVDSLAWATKRASIIKAKESLRETRRNISLLLQSSTT